MSKNHSKIHKNLQVKYEFPKSMLWNITYIRTYSRYPGGWDYYPVNQLNY